MLFVEDLIFDEYVWFGKIGVFGVSCFSMETSYWYVGWFSCWIVMGFGVLFFMKTSSLLKIWFLMNMLGWGRGCVWFLLNIRSVQMMESFLKRKIHLIRYIRAVYLVDREKEQAFSHLWVKAIFFFISSFKKIWFLMNTLGIFVVLFSLPWSWLFWYNFVAIWFYHVNTSSKRWKLLFIFFSNLFLKKNFFYLYVEIYNL